MRRLVVAVSREFGSGGRLLGERIAQELDLRFYDRALIALAARESGFAPEAFEDAETEAANKFLFSLSMGGGAVRDGLFWVEPPMGDRLFIAQSKVIERLAEEGGCVLVENYLDGPEISLFCVCDGATVVPLAPAQDYKRLGDGDAGPNTGGMGSYSPLTWAPQDLTEQVVTTIAQPVVDEMARRGSTFIGLLYCGLALTGQGLRVVEFNVRFGDPETQAVLARLTSPLAGLLHAAATGRLHEAPAPTWSDAAAVDVVLAAPGYPGEVDRGRRITGVGQAQALPGVHVLHAGTGRDYRGRLIATGGRVLSVVATGQSVAAARARAYEAIGLIHLDGAQVRTDIAADR